jgi:hypothetical protein
MKLGKLGLAASAVVVMALASAAGPHIARAQGFDDEGGRDRTGAMKGQPADAQEPNAVSQSAAANGKGDNAATRSWKAGEDETSWQNNRQNHALTRATAGTGVKTPPWTGPADAKSAVNEGTVVKTDNGWTHQGAWIGPTTTADDSAAMPDNGDGAMNTVAAPDSQTGSETATPDNPAPSLASPSE